jgi:hypothetical protein
MKCVYEMARQVKTDEYNYWVIGFRILDKHPGSATVP